MSFSFTWKNVQVVEWKKIQSLLLQNLITREFLQFSWGIIFFSREIKNSLCLPCFYLLCSHSSFHFLFLSLFEKKDGEPDQEEVQVIGFLIFFNF